MDMSVYQMLAQGGQNLWSSLVVIVGHFWVPSVLVDCTATDRCGNLANLSWVPSGILVVPANSVAFLAPLPRTPRMLLRMDLSGTGSWQQAGVIISLKGASGSFGPAEKERLGLPGPLVWQLQEAVGHGSRGLEGFGGFGRFKAFEGSIRKFRASRKRKTWLATAASLAAPRAGLARFERFGGFGRFEAFEGKERLGLPQPRVWQKQKRKHLACHSP